MGDEISNSHFSDQDYQYYYEQLRNETLDLKNLFSENKFSSVSNYCGLEQEAWILNSDYYPAPENQFLLDSLNNDLLSPELARFNIELNVTPQKLSGAGLSKMQSELQALWDLCDNTLNQKNLHLEMVGILPTVSDADLVVDNMSAMKRYEALNEQVLKSRDGKPLSLNIVGIEHLKSVHSDVMLESAATSLQLHRQIDAPSSARYYNASILASAITVAISANAPFLFGKKLWEETRIPLFEQAVEVGGYGHAMNGPIRRVSFGSGYAKQDIFECFNENLQHYPVLLPVKLDTNSKQFSYLRMHNGTIWRWNRPIIGFDSDGTPHLRIEHRVMAAGPTIIDEMANAAFFFGLQEYYATTLQSAEEIVEFSEAKNNFYSAAQHGISAQIKWPNLKDKTISKQSIQNLICSPLLKYAADGLSNLGLDQADIDRYLGVIESRAKSGQTGSVWQKKYLEKNDG
ncbi:MAG: glutamate--cysteine ligase, partial [Gammaproteobacteria bacterium]|nr:glutamate--cysteine ligase [Gammaproteobacteria bacterium]